MHDEKKKLYITKKGHALITQTVAFVKVFLYDAIMVCHFVFILIVH